MKIGSLYSLMVVLVCLGCDKPKPPVSEPLPRQGTPVVTAPSEVAPPPSPTVAATTGITSTSSSESDEPGLIALNRALSAYVMGQLKSPEKLEDLVKAGLLKRLPTAPVGKRYALDASKTGIVLVDQ